MSRSPIIPGTGRPITTGLDPFVSGPPTLVMRLLRAILLLAALPIPAAATMPPSAGRLPPEVAGGFRSGLFALERRPGPGVDSAPLAADWNIPVVMVSYADDTLTHAAATFDTALFDTTSATATGSVSDYWTWVSEGRIRVRGAVVARVRLSGTRAFYAANGFGLTTSGTPRNIYGLIHEALTLCTDDVNWTPFDRDSDGYVDVLWVVHAGTAAEMTGDRNRIWSITSRLSAGWARGGAFVTGQLVPGTTNILYRLDRFSTMPELSVIRPGRPMEIGVYCHEFGHILGLPDLYDTAEFPSASNVGPGNWSLMSTGGYGGNNYTPEFPTHIGAWASVFLGWKEPLRPDRDTTLTLRPLGGGGDVVDVWFEGQPNHEHFLLECRAREEFDRTLNNGGLIVTHLDEATIGQGLNSNRVNAGLTPGLWVVEADGDSDLVVGRNRGDAFDPFPGLDAVHTFDETTVPPARSFAGGPIGIALSGIQRLGRDVRFHLQVRAPGWLPPRDETRGTYAPVPSLGPPSRAVRDGLGNAHRVQSETVAGRSQVVLRSQVGGVWTDAVVLSDSPSGALDPAIATLGARDLVVAWSDFRGGRSRIRYRARLGGVWGAETVVGDLPGENRAPAIGVDGHGAVHLAWLNLENEVPTIGFTRFLYFAPWAPATRLTSGTTQLPSAPALAVSRSGVAHVLWTNLMTAPHRLHFARVHPDSGIAGTGLLTPPPPGSQGPVTAIADSAGTLHVVWASTNLSAREVHYQRRPLAGPPAPRDTVIDSRGAYIEHLSLGTDPSGTLHVAFVSTPKARSQIFYKRWRPGIGWDVPSTEVTAETDGDALAPTVLATRPGTLSIVYTLVHEAPRFMERRRQVEPPVPVLDAAGAAGVPGRLRAGPNPLRSGAALEVRWTGPAATLELFDLGGRRVAAAAGRESSGSWVARFGGELTARLASGVYFARPQGDTGPGLRLVVLR